MTALPAWDALLSRAIVGIDDGSPQARAPVAAVSLRKLAGTLLSRPSLPPSPPDPRPEVSTRAVSHLRQLMADGPNVLLKEWLEAATAAHKRVPFDCIPALLALAAKEAYLRPAIVDAVGPRGLWLASRNQAWRIPKAPEDPAIWEAGSIAERAAWLRHRRGIDPAGARDMLSAAIGGDTAYNRRKLIEVMEVGLSEADEAFLEGMLNDRSREVREAVVELLAQLPHSALVSRMTERADRCIALTSRGELEIQLPDPDSGTLRDGFDPKDQAAVRHRGIRGTLLIRVLSFVPPSYWVQRFGIEAAKFVTLCVNSNNPNDVLDGISRASVRHRDVSWLRALLLCSRPYSHTSLQHELLLSAAPERQRAHLLAEVFHARPELFALDGRDAIVSCPESFLDCFEQPWPEDIATELLPLLSRMAERGIHGYANEMTRVTRFVPRALISQAIAALPQGENRPALVARVEQLLTFRKDMLDAIEEDG